MVALGFTPSARFAVTYPHLSLEPILRGTFGTILFQEQAMRVAVTFAGLSLGEADLLRRAIATLRRRDILALKDRFYAGARSLERPWRAIDEVFDLLTKYCGYGFVKGRAAASQVTAIRQAYIKARWPIHFQAAVLATGPGYYQPRVYIEDALRCGATLAGPCINRSQVGYTVEEGHRLRVGLAFVSEVDEASAERLVAVRGDQPFNSLSDVLARTDLDSEAIANLIDVGAMDVFELPRPALMWQLRASGPRRLAKQPPGPPQQLYLLTVEEPAVGEHWRQREQAPEARSKREQALLGFRITPLPNATVPGTAPLATVRTAKAGTHLRVVAEIVFADRRKTKDGKGTLAGALLSDGIEHVDAILFPSAFQRFYRLMAWDYPLVFEGYVGVVDGEPQLEVASIALIPTDGLRDRPRSLMQ